MDPSVREGRTPHDFLAIEVGEVDKLPPAKKLSRT
jgi:hypothetical protein